MKPLFTATIPGRTPIKKNTQRVFGYGKSKHVVYTSQFKDWERRALWTLRSTGFVDTICEPMFATFRFYLKNRSAEPDVSNLIEGVADALTKANIISDDKLIHKFTAEKIFGDEPRVEINLYRYEAEAA